MSRKRRSGRTKLGDCEAVANALARVGAAIRKRHAERMDSSGDARLITCGMKPDGTLHVVVLPAGSTHWPSGLASKPM